ncbi:trigger factor [Alloprevotella tannerae]|uniref:Trigger factor n=1 Tax=Alloprevotella tannerae TaxID=76122 RepID=A0A929WZ48_9BACT|nr:trigger factor [Alloprevotella tannerae]MBF0970302.1 trigger factor [Alloprevotella tannerae]
MNISFEKSTPVSGTITIQLVKADYAEKVNEALKKMSQKAQMPGFRPGKVPFSLVNKMYGPQAKMEEVNRLLSDKLFGYIKEQKLEVLGEPMGNESQAPQDIENQDDFEFKFDIALAPEFSIELNKKDKVDYYEIEVDDAQVNSQIEEMTRQAGHPEDVEEYRDGDILRGPLTELDEQGQPKEGGIQVERASLMPNYFKADDQKKLFDGAKKNDVITFKPAEAHGDVEAASLLKIKKDEVAQHAGDFSFQVEEISRFVPSELDQKLFDRIFGEGQVKSEEEFRAKIKEQLQHQRVADADYKFLQDARAYAENKVGELEFPKDLLRRFMLANNKDKDEKYVDDNFDSSLKELKWQLIREKLTSEAGIKVEDADMKEMAISAARFQFMQYGINNVPDEYLEKYAQEVLQKQDQARAIFDRVIDTKLTAALKEKVGLKKKKISQEDFEKLFK